MQDQTYSKPLPAYTLYSVKGDGHDAQWTRIGAAWANRDGKGYCITCTAVPADGRLVMRAYERKPQAGI